MGKHAMQDRRREVVDAGNVGLLLLLLVLSAYSLLLFSSCGFHETLVIDGTLSQSSSGVQ
jgi:hypothetical protein